MSSIAPVQQPPAAADPRAMLAARPAPTAAASATRASVREQILRASAIAESRSGGAPCSWGARMPWLPIRQDPRLLRGDDTDNDDRSAQCRYASLSTLASTNASLRELVLAPTPRAGEGVIEGGATAEPQPRRPAYSLLDISTRTIRKELARRAFEGWLRAVSAACAEDAGRPASNAVTAPPRFFRCGDGRRYGVLSEISRGAYGDADTRIEVAVDLCDGGRGGGTMVVLKVHKPHAVPQLCAGGDAASQAEAERAALTRCVHPHVLQVLDWFDEEGGGPVDDCAVGAETLNPDAVAAAAAAAGGGAAPAHILVLEHAIGGSLDQYLRAVAVAVDASSSVCGEQVSPSSPSAAGPAGALSSVAALDLCTQLFGAVAHCHSSAIATAHRDIKPANCLLFPDSSRRSGWLLKLADFGLATTPTGTSTDASAASTAAVARSFDIGTEPYQSPEICGLIYSQGGDVHSMSCRDLGGDGSGSGNGYDPFKSDLWSLGCTAFEICALRMACRCAPDAVMHLTQPPTPSSSSASSTLFGSTTMRIPKLKQATIPPLPPPPLFTEERLIASDADTSSAVAVAVAVREAVDGLLHSWSLAQPGLRQPVGELLSSAGWRALLQRCGISRVREPDGREQATKQHEDDDVGSHVYRTVVLGMPTPAQIPPAGSCASVDARWSLDAHHASVLQDDMDLQFDIDCDCLHEQEQEGDQGHMYEREEQEAAVAAVATGCRTIAFGGVTYAMLPLTQTTETMPDNDENVNTGTTEDELLQRQRRSAVLIVSMEAGLRKVYCPAELAELELLMLSTLLSQQKALRRATTPQPQPQPGAAASVESSQAAPADNLRVVEDRLVFQLVGTLAHRRHDYARRVHGIELLVRAGLHKTFAAQGYHLVRVA